jgi:energy-coupling factor transporter ATP-binding protein EcfA2
MLSRVVIKNFKSIGGPGVDLELRPLTLLVGPNGSGKSSILEAIAVASQQNVSGKLTSFPTWASIVPHWNANNPTEIIDIYFDPVDQGDKLGFSGSAGGIENLNIKLLTDDEAKKDVTQKLKGELDHKTFLISSVRGDVPYHTNVNINPQWVGVRGQNLIQLLSIIFGQIRHETIADKVIQWARRFGMATIGAGVRSNDQGGILGSDYRDDRLKSVHDLALASSGTKQILTVITQLFWSPEGSLLMIEEPEISLPLGGKLTC